MSDPGLLAVMRMGNGCGQPGVQLPHVHNELAVMQTVSPPSSAYTWNPMAMGLCSGMAALRHEPRCLGYGPHLI